MRKRPPVLAHQRFVARQAELEGLDLQDLFTRIYRTNLWGGDESRSGLGSALEATSALRRSLPPLFERFAIGSILDLPCGDFGWMRHVELGERTYVGADIVPELIAHHQATFGRADGSIRFVHRDIVRDELPRADLVLCRDCLVHLSFANIFAAFANLRRSGAKWLLTTTFLDHDQNRDAVDGDWRMLNLMRPPFELPQPDAMVNEECTEAGGAYRDKALGLWPLAALPDSGVNRFTAVKTIAI
jgi:SAM-dependent methyltransferase